MQNKAIRVINQFHCRALVELFEFVAICKLVHVLEDFWSFVVTKELSEELQDARIRFGEISTIVIGKPTILI